MRSVVRLRSRQLVGLRHREKFVEGVEAREIVTLAAVEKTLLPDVNVEEPEKRAERQTLREQFQFPPATDGAAADLSVAAGKLALGRDARLPVRVTIMFFHEHFHAWERVVVHLASEPANRSVYDHVFVDFVVAAARVGVGQLLITA